MDGETVLELDGVEEGTAAEATAGATLKGAAVLFATGLLGGALTIVGLVGVASPLLLSSRCCGASAAPRTQQARCMELGVTPEELAALDAAGRTGPALAAGLSAPAADRAERPSADEDLGDTAALAAR